MRHFVFRDRYDALNLVVIHHSFISLNPVLRVLLYFLVTVTAFMDFSCSVAVPGSGSNKEYALHQLYFNKGDLKRAVLCLMSKKISPSFVKFIGDYHYQDSDIWTTDDIEIYTEAIMKADKDFGGITAAVSLTMNLMFVVM